MTSVAAYTAADREATLKSVIDANNFPRLEAFNRMTPKQLTTMMTMYGAATAEGAFEYFTPMEVEVVFTAVSAANNCELCLSFHSMTMGQHKRSQKDIDEISAGGLPQDPELRKLVVATKYALAHKGVFLPREAKHLASMGFSGEKLTELNFLAGTMSAFNQNYVHLVSEGLEMEDMLKGAGPFKETVYKSEL
jgi:AhpD family alkylhydroperoxidase